MQRLGPRGADAVVEGNCRMDGEITATLLQKNQMLPGWDQRFVGTARKGKFTAQLMGIPAGGPYRLIFRVGPESVTLKSFYVGDVWLLAGQSNMEGVGNLDQAAKPHPLIRAFSMRREWRLAEDPLHVRLESPDVCHHQSQQLSREDAEKNRHRPNGKGVGPGLFFAEEMRRRSGVPQGLICTAHGGTTMAQWDPQRKSLKGESLYYSMLESVKATGQPVAGMLWYQGESDCHPAAVARYADCMKKLVVAVRRDLRQPDLAWVVVQLGCFTMAGGGESWNAIRELQRQLPGKISRLDTVATIDLSLDDWIHISSEGQAILGKRMAHSAARLVWGDPKEIPPPRLAKIHPVQAIPGRAFAQDVEFADLPGSLEAAGEPLGFAYVNRENQIVPLIYRTTLHGKTVRLHLTENPKTKGCHLGYGLGHHPVCNIRDERGFSLPAFTSAPPQKLRARLPFVTRWKVSAIHTAARPLAKISCPDLDSQPYEVKAYESNEGFVNERPNWMNQSGQVYFAAVLELPEAMDLKFLLGYDGPFRMWVNGKRFFQDLLGTNPAVADSQNQTAKLPAGRHRVTVAMDLNDGKAWGFFLRLERMGVLRKQLLEQSFVKPVYHV